MMRKIVNDFDFDRDILARSMHVPVILEISAPGCGPCQWMERTLIEVTREYAGKIEFVSIPIEMLGAKINEMDLRSNPTTILYKDGIEKARLRGALPKEVIIQWVNDWIK